MKYCSHCGKEINEEAVVCTGCGCAVKTNKFNKTDSNNQFKTLAFVFMIINTCLFLFLGFFSIYMIYSYSASVNIIITRLMHLGIVGSFISLGWRIPMIIILKSRMNKNEDIGIEFKICTLLFVDIIAGILLICDRK